MPSSRRTSPAREVEAVADRLHCRGPAPVASPAYGGRRPRRLPSPAVGALRRRGRRSALRQRLQEFTTLLRSESNRGSSTPRNILRTLVRISSAVLPSRRLLAMNTPLGESRAATEALAKQKPAAGFFHPQMKTGDPTAAFLAKLIDAAFHGFRPLGNSENPAPPGSLRLNSRHRTPAPRPAARLPMCCSDSMGMKLGAVGETPELQPSWCNWTPSRASRSIRQPPPHKRKVGTLPALAPAGRPACGLLARSAETAEQVALPNLRPAVAEDVAGRRVVRLAGQHVAVGLDADRISPALHAAAPGPTRPAKVGNTRSACTRGTACPASGAGRASASTGGQCLGRHGVGPAAAPPA